MTVVSGPADSCLGERYFSFELLRESGPLRIYECYSKATHSPHIVKHWASNESADLETLSLIWHQEIRMLHRVAATRGIGDLIARIHYEAQDSSGLYLVFDADGRLPLPALQISRGRLDDQAMALFWQNIRRAAIGIGIFHAHGLILRNLDLWSLLTSKVDRADFQIFPVEPCVSVKAHMEGSGQRSLDPDVRTSFQDDWRRLRKVAWSWLKRVALMPESLDEESSPLSAAERRYCRSLITPDDGTPHSVELELKVLDELIRRRSGYLDAKSRSLAILCDFREGQDIDRLLVGRTEAETQLDRINVIESDLCEPTAFQVRKGRVLLVGREFQYELRPYKLNDEAIPQMMMVISTRPVDLANANLNHPLPIPNQPIRVATHYEVRTKLAEIQSSYRRWDEYLPATAKGEQEQTDVWRSLVLLHGLVCLIAITRVWPVRLSRKADENPSLIEVVPHEDQRVTELFAALGLRSPSEELRNAILEDRGGDSRLWSIDVHGRLKVTDQRSCAIRFVDVLGRSTHAEKFVFELLEPLPQGEFYFVRQSEEAGGTSAQLARQAKILRQAAEHGELMRCIDDLSQELRTCYERWSFDHLDLDASKQKAATALANIMPLNLVQGPPGVGKTHLVAELVQSMFKQNASCRLLISAQNHDSVDHLMSAVQERLAAAGQHPIVVRSGNANGEGNVPSVETSSRDVVSALSTSPAMGLIDAGLRNRVTRMARRIASERDAATESLILRSANVVYSTVNSADVEALVEERSSFDWTIVEEAGRATAGELLGSLMLSHRRLLIGDHHQLPPFEADRYKRLLGQPAVIRDALARNLRRIEGVLGDLSRQFPETEDEWSALSLRAQMLLPLFEYLFEDQHRRESRAATQLTIQHRMHPKIARLISHVFYQTNLETDSKRQARFREEICPIWIKRVNQLPRGEVIWINEPYVQSTHGLRSVESGRYQNAPEVQTVLAVLRNIRVDRRSKKLPKLAILSPYQDQVTALDKAIKRLLKTELRHLSHFEAVEDGRYTSTGDGFQGNEADIVIVSLVRNNSHSYLGRSLGFLQDRRRLNVILSRAKWKLIVVGSLDFFKAKAAQVDAQDPLFGFLPRLIHYVQDRSSGVRVIPSSRVLSV